MSNLDPCSLLTAEELRKFGQRFNGPTPGKTGSARECEYQKPFDVEPSGSLVISPAIREEQGIKDAVDRGFGIQKTESNGRQFARIPSAGSCTVAIGVSESSRVDIYVGMAAGTEKSCETASEIADIVAPKLPEG